MYWKPTRPKRILISKAAKNMPNGFNVGRMEYNVLIQLYVFSKKLFNEIKRMFVKQKIENKGWSWWQHIFGQKIRLLVNWKRQNTTLSFRILIRCWISSRNNVRLHCKWFQCKIHWRVSTLWMHLQCITSGFCGFHPHIFKKC